ncbi:alpha-galactosidase [Xylanibacter oryzae]|uniref:alpha-galactosidase n=1 Tax=Xylanibacter oryzae TaxID=185293 RepID=UPI0004B9CD89|nr:alpha-galactosidase [Xylanibacter oryzae]
MKKLTFIFVVLLSMTANVWSKTNIVISTDNTQLILQVKENGRLYQTYLGERLADGTDLDLLDMPRTNVTQTQTKGNEVYPVMGTEDYFEPAMEIRHVDGNATSILKYISHSSKAINGGTETIIKLKDDLYPVNVTLHFAAYEKDNIIKEWTEISHNENGLVSLSRYASSMLYFEESKYFLTEFHSDWAKEMQMTKTPLIYGKKVIDTRLGTRAAMFSQPFFEVGLGEDVAENSGKVLMGTIGWTGNFRFTFDIDHDNELRIISGINPDASCYMLKKGEVLKTPEFIFTLSTKGIGEGSRNFQRWAMKYQLRKGDGDRYTLLNNWENTYFNFDEAKLTSLFKEAKDLGVDLFLLDDGWFGNKYPRKDDHAGLGDWQATKTKLPNGIPYLVKAANEAGVKFGIWIEPEMVNPKSELAEKHPNWMLKLPNRETYYYRNQLVLDLTNPKVQDFVFGIVDNIMTENPGLKFFKWDCNSPITNIYSTYEKEKQGNLYVDYVKGLYNVLQRIQKKYPDLTLMMCSGGGGRCDYEALKYFDEYWCSDNTDPVERLYIQWGFSQFMPAKAMCSHVTNWNRTSSIKFRVDVDMSCKLGFDIDLKSLKANEMQFCKEAVKEYNRLKPLIYSANIYRLASPYNGDHCVIQRVSDDKTHALVFAYDIHPRFMANLLPTKMEGLNPSALYTVKEVNLMPGEKSKLSFDNKTYTGDYLMKIGLMITSTNEMSSRIIEMTQK